MKSTSSVDRSRVESFIHTYIHNSNSCLNDFLQRFIWNFMRYNLHLFRLHLPPLRIINSPDAVLHRWKFPLCVCVSCEHNEKHIKSNQIKFVIQRHSCKWSNDVIHIDSHNVRHCARILIKYYLFIRKWMHIPMECTICGCDTFSKHATA